MPIRRIAGEDRAVYLEMAAEFYASGAVLHPVPAVYFERTFDEMLRSSVYLDGFLLMAEDGAIAGYAVVSKTFSQEVGGMAAWMEEIYVRPMYQGQGLGRAFLEEYERLRPEMVRLRLEVEPENRRAIRLYERLGYTEMGYYQMVKDKG